MTPNRSTRLLRRSAAGLALALAGAAASSSCLQRPIADQSPNVQNLFVDQIRQSSVDKIDLLFMVDNSASMADKQEILQAAVPDLVSRLVNPVCVEKQGGEVVATYPPPADPNAACPQGDREFKPIKDIHIGIVTSSLGGHGADSCSPGQGSTFNVTMDDKGHLLTRDVDGNPLSVPFYNNQGFLQWDPDQKKTPPGIANSNDMITHFQTLVDNTGEKGCGFEASLEAWYRFLIDPDPYLSIVRVPCFAGDGSNGCAAPDGLDEQLKAQRAAFLRPDSLVAVIMLTDENDCSTIDGGQYFISLQASQGAQPFLLPRSTAACDTNPNDPCCYSCGQPAPAGCASPDSKCSSLGNFYTQQEKGDQLNLRCFHQKQRFGIDFLQPISRYVRGLSGQAPEKNYELTLDVPDRAGALVPNPLFSDLTGAGAVARDPSLIFFATIVGVPWQDIATPETLNDPAKLKFLKAEEIGAQDVWGRILGDPANGVPPSDPLMIESILPRQGANPVTGAALVPPGAVAPEANPINGHEWNIADNDDLQYACIFKLTTPRDCTGQLASCDCASQVDTAQKPLCQAPGSTAYGSTQHFAKAFPGIRHLEVAKGFGKNSIVASICPKDPTNTGSDAFGYRPAIAAIIERLAEALSFKCLPRELTPDPETGKVECEVVEAVKSDQGCDCLSKPGRALPNDKLVQPVLEQLSSSGICGPSSPSAIPCSAFCLCSINQAEGQVLAECQNNGESSSVGFCYIDPAVGVGNEALVEACPASQRRQLLFVGPDTPTAGSTVFIACKGSSFDSTK